MILLVCPGMQTSSNGKCVDNNGYTFGYYTWSGGDKNILQITTGMENDKTLGYHFPTVNLDTDRKLSVYMPKSDNWDYKVAQDNM